MDAETVLRQTQLPNTKKRLFPDRISKMKPELCLVSSEQTDPYPKKLKTKKERLLALAQKMARENADNTNEMFEIMKMED